MDLGCAQRTARISLHDLIAVEAAVLSMKMRPVSTRRQCRRRRTDRARWFPSLSAFEDRRAPLTELHAGTPEQIGPVIARQQQHGISLNLLPLASRHFHNHAVVGRISTTF